MTPFDGAPSLRPMAARKAPTKPKGQSRHEAELRAARDFRNWADLLSKPPAPERLLWLADDAENPKDERAPDLEASARLRLEAARVDKTRAKLLAAHVAAVRAYLGVDDADHLQHAAWMIVEKLNDALTLQKSEGAIAELWRGMQRSATDLRLIAWPTWLAAVEKWQGQKARRGRGKPKGGDRGYDWFEVVHPLLNEVRGDESDLSSTKKLLKKMPWDAHAPLHATTYEAFKSKKS